ncbi:hypothetical protein BCR35DRAFT_310721 [Leucosporidium creatinivorum]|uniref:Ser-Thr-rich glycosyl-phosphatidyl-inositol-anchored membrane family-domain-containing protein n=1 Tax=Leucosporidium creatinivorum TaxID=106004 RepID=A0A1Y2CWK7_9BASI|nr:hypothetical protein BCR35DRAFT_310721 [Leucosporidium creatinivorum]
MIPSTRVLPSSLIALLLASLPLASSAPVAYPASPLEERAGSTEATAWGDIPEGVSFISYWPAITTPVAGQVWQEGDSVQISWNGTAPPYAANQLSQEADIVLGYLSNTSAGYHLDINHPLATVQLYSEPYSINITLPTNITTRDSYLLILGSSANSSPLFTIEGTGPADDSSASSSTAAATSTSKAIEARPTTYVVGGQTTVLGQSSNIAAPVVSDSQSQESFSDGNGGATTSSSADEASFTNTPYDSSSTQGPLAGATPSESNPSDSAAATPSPSPSPTSVALASQEQTVTVTSSSASAAPTSAAISLKGSSWVVMAVGGALGLSLLL